MANVVSRVARRIARIPGQIVKAAGWARMEPAGLGVEPAPGDVEDLEAARRREREVLRQGVDETESPDT